MRDRSVNVKCASAGKRKREGAQYPGYYLSSLPFACRAQPNTPLISSVKSIENSTRLVEAAERIAESLTGSTRT